MRLDGKVALITGAASGIGKSIAETYAKAGAAIAIADLNQAGADATAAEIVAAGGKAIGIAMDVTNEAAVDKGTDLCVEKLGGLDIMISNAGIQIVKPIVEFAFADWQKMLAIHMDGAFLTTRAAMRHMYKDKKGGAIIYMGSVHSHEASKLKAPYVAAKHGLLGLARVAAKEGAEYNVRVNVICPGYINTEMVQAVPKDVLEKNVIPQIPVSRLGEPEEIARAVAFLASDDAGFITGSTLSVNGGQYLA